MKCQLWVNYAFNLSAASMCLKQSTKTHQKSKVTVVVNEVTLQCRLKNVSHLHRWKKIFRTTRLISLSSESEDGIWSNAAEIRFRVALIVLFTRVRSNPAANRACAHALLLARFKSNQFYIYRPSLGGFHNLALPATPLYPFSGYFLFFFLRRGVGMNKMGRKPQGEQRRSDRGREADWHVIVSARRRQW